MTCARCLRGKTGTLRVPGVAGNFTLDATALDAREIIFTGEIDGRSSVKLFSPRSGIEFRGLAGGTRLDYHQAVGNLPELRVEAGKVSDQAKLKRD